MRDYDAQKQYRDHLQVFIDRFRYNANRAAQVQSKIKIIDKLPVIYPPEAPEEVKLNFSPAEEDIIGGTLLQIDNVTFQYSEKTRVIFEVRNTHLFLLMFLWN
jgi:ATP-binding cassette subfamily F protein 3